MRREAEGFVTRHLNVPSPIAGYVKSLLGWQEPIRRV
jgi:hypothetical protein